MSKGKHEFGPIYGVLLPKDSMPIGGGMYQAMPSEQDLNHCLKCAGGPRVVGALEVMVDRLRIVQDQLADETRRLDWMFSASGDQLNALDQWDRDNIDDAIDREGAE